MALIRYRDFKGTVPRRSPRLLPHDAAQVAENCQLWNGEIRPFKDKIQVDIPYHGENARTIYRYVDNSIAYWLNWDAVVNVAKSPLGSDSLNRIYYTGDGVPKKTGNDIALADPGNLLPAAWYYMGVYTPVTAPSPTLDTGGTGTEQTRFYVYIFVTGWSEEGAPSPAGSVASVPAVGSTVAVDLSSVANPDAAYNITKAYVYRTVTGDDAVDFRKVGEITWDYDTAANNTIDDTLDDEDLGTSLFSYTFAEPPTDLKCLTTMPGSFMAGISGKYIYFSEPGYPYAWPTSYRKIISDTPVALAAVRNLLVVGTDLKPYGFQGVAPAYMSPLSLMSRVKCESQESMVETPGGCVMASNMGVHHVSMSGGDSIISRPLLAQQDWQLLNPSTMRGAVQDGRYYCSYEVSIGGTRKLFIYDPSEPQNAFSFVDLDVQTMFSGDESNLLYMLIGGVIYSWDTNGDNPLNFTYRTKREPLAGERNLGYAKIKGDFYLSAIIGADIDFATYATYLAALDAINDALEADLADAGANGAQAMGLQAMDGFIDELPDVGSGVTFRLYGNDATLRLETTVSDERPFALPGGFLVHEVSAEVEGKIRVEEIQLADDFSDFDRG